MMKVMVVDTYDPDRTPKYTWKWEAFRPWKPSHWKSLYCNVYRWDDENETKHGSS